MRRPLLAALAILCLAVAAPAQAHPDGPPGLAFAWPALGTVTTRFGWTGSSWHAGLDIGILRSLEVRAAAPGLVRLVGAPHGYEGYGTVILVDVGGPYATLYAHLARTLVRPGDLVAAGEQIGIAGCTGWCTGTHLHFEVRRNGLAIDPTALLP